MTPLGYVKAIQPANRLVLPMGSSLRTPQVLPGFSGRDHGVGPDVDLLAPRMRGEGFEEPLEPTLIPVAVADEDLLVHDSFLLGRSR
jgi:hypothetical protein